MENEKDRPSDRRPSLGDMEADTAAAARLSTPGQDACRPGDTEWAQQPSYHVTVSTHSTSTNSSSEHGEAEKAAESSPAQPSINDLSSIQDSGLQAWLQVIGAFFLFFNTFGLTNAYGVYQSYYATGELFTTSTTNISWVGSIQGFLLLFLGPLTGPIYDAGHFSFLIITGSGFVVLGQMMLSLSHEYYQVLLAQGICMGIGAGFLFLPCMAILSQYFNKRLAMATGIATSGAGLGGIFFPLILTQLLPRYGFAWATRILGFIHLATLILPMLVMRVRVFPSEQRRLLDLQAFQEAPYTLYTIGCFLAWLGLYVPYFYIAPYSRAAGMESVIHAYILTFLNAGSVVGRLASTLWADRTGPMNMMVPATTGAGIVALCLVPATNAGGLVVTGVLYGVFSGAITSLYPTVYVHLSMHRRALIGTRMGMATLTAGVALLLGNPIAGWTVDAHGYGLVWVLCGLFLLLGSCFMAAGRCTKTRAQGIFVRA